MPKIVRSSKNKINLRRVVTHSLCFPSFYNPGRAARPPLHHARPCPFCHSALSTLLVTFYFLHCAPYQITLYSSFLLLYYLNILFFARLVPPLEVFTPPAGLFPLDSCAPAPVAFRLWLPSSCHGSRIANPSLNIYPMTYMLASKPCLSLCPSFSSITSITLRIVTPQHSILLLQ